MSETGRHRLYREYPQGRGKIFHSSLVDYGNHRMLWSRQVWGFVRRVVLSCETGGIDGAAARKLVAEEAC